MKNFIFLLLVCGCMFLAGCGLPAAGPISIPEKPGNTAAGNLPYEVVDVTPNTLKSLELYKAGSLASHFAEKLSPPRSGISIGDQIVVTIWEAASGGLFSDGATTDINGARATTIPQQAVGPDGVISVPYAGQIPVVGLTPVEASAIIQKRLAKKAIKPQVLVSIVSNGGAWASVAGDVTGAARVPLSPKGDRLLDVISEGGGVKALPFETHVRLTRDGETETVSLDTILKSPDENIFVRPGDQIYVYREPVTYIALGAVTAQKDYPIDQEKFSLAQAVARAGGLLDSQASTGAVFLFRYESPDVVRALNPQSPLLSGTAPVPVIYRIDFDRPESYFYADAIQIRDKDLIYVANASSVQFNKFLNILRTFASIYGSLRINSITVN